MSELKYTIGDKFERNNEESFVSNLHQFIKITGVNKDERAYSLSIDQGELDVPIGCYSESYLDTHYIKVQPEQPAELKYNHGDIFTEANTDTNPIKFLILAIAPSEEDPYYVEYLHTNEGGNYGYISESYIDCNFDKTGDISSMNKEEVVPMIDGPENLTGKREDGPQFKNIDNDFAEITSSICKMLEVKNKRYGCSALNPLDIFAKHHDYGSRLDEKLARVKNSEELRKNDVADVLGGLILICKDKGWKNFDDQID